MSDNEKKIEIPVDALDKWTDFIEKQKEINKCVEDLEAGSLSDEEFNGKVGELVKGQLEDHEKAYRHEVDRKITFSGATLNTDKAAHSFKSALAADKITNRHALFQRAMTTTSKNDEIRALYDLNDECIFIDTILRWKDRALGIQTYPGIQSLATYQKYRNQLDIVLKAIAPMDTTDTAEFVPTALSANVLDLPWIYGSVETLFEHLPCPTNDYTVPVDTSPVTTIADLIGESTTADRPDDWDVFGQNITDAALTFSAKKLRSRMITSAELDEDSVILWLPYIRKRLAQIMGNTVEAAILNGDTTATHMDSDIEALGANDGRTAWDGIRDQILAESLEVDLSSGNLSEANLLKVKAACGKYGVRPNEGAWIFGPQSYVSQVIKLDGCKKVNEYGPNATIHKGELAQYFGSPVVVSDHQREDVNASGVYDDTTTTKGVCMYVNREYFKIGDRRLITLDGEKWITSDQFNLVCFRRLDFKPVTTVNSTNPLAGMGYNFSPSG